MKILLVNQSDLGLKMKLIMLKHFLEKSWMSSIKSVQGFKKAITKFLLKTWKENIEDTEDHLMESVAGELMSDVFL